MPIIYPTVEDILDVYGVIFDCSPQQAADQLRSRAGLEAALARPQQFAYYEGAAPALQAAVLAHAIVEGQYFIEGNKRLALLSMLDFLEEKGYAVTAFQEECVAWIVLMAPPEPDTVDPPPRASVEKIGDAIRACLIIRHT